MDRPNRIVLVSVFGMLAAFTGVCIALSTGLAFLTTAGDYMKVNIGVLIDIALSALLLVSSLRLLSARGSAQRMVRIYCVLSFAWIGFIITMLLFLLLDVRIAWSWLYLFVPVPYYSAIKDLFIEVVLGIESGKQVPSVLISIIYYSLWLFYLPVFYLVVARGKGARWLETSSGMNSADTAGRSANPEAD